MKVITGFKSFEKATAHRWFSFWLVFLRIFVGLEVLAAGVAGLQSGFTLYGPAFLPISLDLQRLSENIFVDQLFLWTLIVVGLGFILGVFIRPLSFISLVLVIISFITSSQSGVNVLTVHVLFAILFLIFIGGGIGHVVGLDGMILRNSRKRKMLITLLFG